jgi:hypothetical protein
MQHPTIVEQMHVQHDETNFWKLELLHLQKCCKNFNPKLVCCMYFGFQIPPFKHKRTPCCPMTIKLPYHPKISTTTQVWIIVVIFWSKFCAIKLSNRRSTNDHNLNRSLFIIFFQFFSSKINHSPFQHSCLL